MIRKNLLLHCLVTKRKMLQLQVAVLYSGVMLRKKKLSLLAHSLVEIVSLLNLAKEVFSVILQLNKNLLHHSSVMEMQLKKKNLLKVCLVIKTKQHLLTNQVNQPHLLVSSANQLRRLRLLHQQLHQMKHRLTLF